MADETTTHALDDAVPDAVGETANATVLVEDVLVEEVSIDGMCGVY